MIRLETALPTGGLHTASLDSWTTFEKDAQSMPLWLSDVRATLRRPLHFVRPLRWLLLHTTAIAARPGGTPGDVWGRLARFIQSVQVNQLPPVYIASVLIYSPIGCIYEVPLRGQERIVDLSSLSPSLPVDA